MQKLFQKGGISDITSNKMTIFKNKMVFGKYENRKKHLILFEKVRKLFFSGLQELKLSLMRY